MDLKNYFSIANSISFLRVILAVVSCAIFLPYYREDPTIYLKSYFSVSILFVIALDALDGIVARLMNEESEFGAKFDIFCDRLVENIYLVFYVFFLKLIPLWILLFFILRGFFVDYVSFKGIKPLGGSFLRSSRFMRAFYGVLKVLLFVSLVWKPLLLTDKIDLVDICLYLTLFVSLLRALPVVQDFLHAKNFS